MGFKNINNPKEIIEKIKTTGFPLEIEVFNKLKSAGLYAESSKYIDEDSNESRELDIEAAENYGRDEDIGKGGFFMSHFIVQCKKLFKAWIFFDNSQTKELKSDQLYHICNCRHPLFHVFLKNIIADKKTSEFFKKIQGESKIHKSFLQIPKNKDYLYEAIITTVKAKRYFQKLYSDKRYLGGDLIRIFYPIIVTDEATLWSASLEEKNVKDLDVEDLKRVKFIVLKFDYLKELRGWETNIVFITSIEYLDSLIRVIREMNDFLYKEWDLFCRNNKNDKKI